MPTLLLFAFFFLRAISPVATSFRPPLIVFDGNSLTAGYTVTRDNAYPAQCVAQSPTPVVSFNKGLNSATTRALVKRAPAEIDSLFSNDRKWNVVVMWEASNALAEGASAKGALAGYKKYAADRHSKGWKVIMLSVLPRSVGAYGTPAEFEQKRQEFNHLLRSDHTWLDGFVDIGADPVLGHAGADADKRYYADGVHLTSSGYAIVARAVTDELARLGVVKMARAAPIIQHPQTQSPALPSRAWAAAGFFMWPGAKRNAAQHGPSPWHGRLPPSL